MIDVLVAITAAIIFMAILALGITALISGIFALENLTEGITKKSCLQLSYTSLVLIILLSIMFYVTGSAENTEEKTLICQPYEDSSWICKEK